MPDVADSREAIALKNTGVFVDATPEGEKGVDYVTALAGTLIEKRAETRKALRIWAWHSRISAIDADRMATQFFDARSGWPATASPRRSPRATSITLCGPSGEAVRPRGRCEARVFVENGNHQRSIQG